MVSTIAYIIWLLLAFYILKAETRIVVTDIKQCDNFWHQTLPLYIILILNTFGWILATICVGVALLI